MDLGASTGIDMEEQMVILDIGIDYTKVGLSKDSTPRQILKTPLSISSIIRLKDEIGPLTLVDIMKESKKVKHEIHEFLYEVFIIHCLLKTKGSKICILEQLIFPRSFMQSLAEVLYLEFEFSKVYFFLADLLPLYTTGLDSGIMVD